MRHRLQSCASYLPLWDDNTLKVEVKGWVEEKAGRELPLVAGGDEDTGQFGLGERVGATILGDPGADNGRPLFSPPRKPSWQFVRLRGFTLSSVYSTTPRRAIEGFQTARARQSFSTVLTK